MPDSLLTGLSALRTHQRAMEVTGHNIANAATPGYARQRSDLAAPTPEQQANLQIGRGVDVLRIRRMADQLIGDRLRDAQGEQARLTTIKQRLQSLENAFNEPSDSGLGAVTARMYAVLDQLSGNPESGALRSAAVQELRTWATTVGSLGDAMQTLSDDVAVAAETEVDAVNALAQQIADLNIQIRRARGANSEPNDLIDQRERLLAELASKIDVRTRTDALGAVSVDVRGYRLVGPVSANTLRVGTDGDGRIAVLAPSGGTVEVGSGSLGALVELSRETVPGLRDQLDAWAATFARAANAVHATSTLSGTGVRTWTADAVIPDGMLDADLDDRALAPASSGQPGIPAAFAPSFTGATGQATARNLVVNVVETATGIARKTVIRYDPSSGAGTRTINDLVAAINTGAGGGFTVIAPQDRVGVANLSAQLVPADGGHRLQLQAAQGFTVDFSPALDQRISAGRWSGGSVDAVATTGLDPALGRLQFTVETTVGGAQRLAVTSRSATDGSITGHGTIPLGTPGTTSLAIGAGSIDVTIGNGPWRDGDSFAAGVDGVSGLLLQRGLSVAGTFSIDNERAFQDAAIDIKGRYTGSLGFAADPDGSGWTDWSVRVTRDGTVGAAASSDPSAAQPPEVEFTWWSGTPGAEVRNTRRVQLDNTRPAGSPVEIADGVYAVFGRGLLTAPAGAEAMQFTVDADPDSAGLLPAMGIGALFTGSTASSIAVAGRIADDPSLLHLGRSRVVGDSSGALALTALRQERIFNGGTIRMDDAYQAVLADLGQRISSADRMSENQASVEASLQSRRDQVSAVNIDEEVGQLILQQQAYTAAARIVTTARENIQTLLDLVQ